MSSAQVEIDARSLSPRNCRSFSIVASFKWSQAMSAIILWPSLPQPHAWGWGNSNKKAATAANHDRKRMLDDSVPMGSASLVILLCGVRTLVQNGISTGSVLYQNHQGIGRAPFAPQQRTGAPYLARFSRDVGFHWSSLWLLGHPMKLAVEIGGIPHLAK